MQFDLTTMLADDFGVQGKSVSWQIQISAVGVQIFDTSGAVVSKMAKNFWTSFMDIPQEYFK